MNRYKATLILILASSIYIISYPFHKTFIGGLVSSGSCASMIGGFADWWGINKLLKKTIPKNKQKIFDGLSNMVSEELLSKNTLKKLLNKYDTSRLVIELVKNNNEIENIKNIFKIMIKDNVKKINKNELFKITSNLIINILKRTDLHKLISSIIKVSFKTEYKDKFYNFILDELILYSQRDDFKEILINFIIDARASYEGESKRKKFVDRFKGNNNLAIGIQEKIKNFLDDMKKPDNDNRLLLDKWIYDKLDDFKNNSNYKLKIENWKLDFLKTIKVNEYINLIFENAGNKILNNEDLYNKPFFIIDNWINDLDDNLDTQRRVDLFLKDLIYKFIDDKHKNVGKIVKENLSKYSDTMLIELIESNAGNDLQLIRINGSLVGGVVGIIIYIIKYSIGVYI
ncbi:DUF445 domain-containing protein [Clostridium estertheticum]|uniref:DUF445 domain-containing protein n=1 Tax=Clostridium estertheticum TaxID=238834 RepID=UPI001CF0E861|nr:DUF445 domain-containing protein [Clostridium estertheticum]MCB2307213.1 DUF445 domain-containing protein [Clostridium estertheticum]MCB2344141.1 DUF445 domain-containing protein [Clostridium estertheticum]MCB2348245.1 DUF445 domain-containing protein [Clostridium estertheticum]WAG45878.1 DUF445 domain-containing protein [Clostridium estertheticum]